jgi:hypothetical protein
MNWRFYFLLTACATDTHLAFCADLPSRSPVASIREGHASLRVAYVDIRRILETHPQLKGLRERKEDSIDTAGSKRREVLRRIQLQVNREARQRRLDLVFDSSGKSRDEMPVVLYCSGMNLTDEIFRHVQ